MTTATIYFTAKLDLNSPLFPEGMTDLEKMQGWIFAQGLSLKWLWSVLISTLLERLMSDYSGKVLQVAVIAAACIFALAMWWLS